MALSDEQILKMISDLHNSKAPENKVVSPDAADIWQRSCKAAERIIDLYSGSYDKKEMGKKPDVEVVIKIIFNRLLAFELNKVIELEKVKT